MSSNFNNLNSQMGNNITTNSQENLTEKCLICKKKSECNYCEKCTIIIMQIKHQPENVIENTQLILNNMYLVEYVKNIADAKCRTCGILSREILFNNYCLTCGVTNRLDEISKSLSDENNKIKLVYNPSVHKVTRLKMQFDFQTLLSGH